MGPYSGISLVVVVVVVAFPSRARIGGESTIHCPPALFFLFFFFKWILGRAH